jgi:hypothetical protein
MNIENYYQLVERCISSLGVDPTTCRGKETGQWTLRKGSANVWVDVWYSEKETRSYVQVMSPVMEIKTTDTTAFYKELLEINDKLYGCAFTIYNNWVWLKVIRETDGLEDNEFMAMLNRIGNYADQYDNYLIDKYNAVEAGTAPH